MMTKSPVSSWADILFPKPNLNPAPNETYPPPSQGINLKNRFEHTHILGGSGHGKTQLIQYLIARDLEEDCCVVVLDNQRQMIPKLAGLGVDMAYISPHLPLALNLFDFPRGHTTIPLLQYVLSALMEAPLTPKQELIFQFGVALVLALKGNIMTFLRVLEDEQFDLSGVDDTTRLFFETNFYDRQYKQTKQEISWRIWSLLKNPVIRDMFSADVNKVKLDHELSRKLILIDADVDLLQSYSGLFGRFFLAQLLQVAQNRFAGAQRPVYVYIDECYFYLDQSIVSMLETARKAKMGLVLAHQYLGQIKEPRVREAIMSLTATKYAGGLSPSDSYAMAQAMHSEPNHLQVPKLTFAHWQRGRNFDRTPPDTYRAHYWVDPVTGDPVEAKKLGPVPGDPTARIHVPTGVVESMPKHPIPVDKMTARYGRGSAKLTPAPPPATGDPDDVDESGEW